MKKKIYLSHPIRGISANPVPTDSGAFNVQMAIYMGRLIRRNIPGIEVYIPGEHQYFVQRAFDKKMLNDKQILEIDCDILKEDCHYVVFYNPQQTMSSGMLTEQDAAQKVGHPTLTFTHMTWEVLEDIRKLTL